MTSLSVLQILEGDELPAAVALNIVVAGKAHFSVLLLEETGARNGFCTKLLGVKGRET